VSAWAAGLVALAAAHGLGTTAEAAAAEDAVLLPGQTIERALGAKEVHEYRVLCRAGDYVGSTVEQRGVDVAVVVVGPDGAELLSVDTPTGRRGTETAPFVADHDGEYRLRVRGLGADPNGTYAVRLEPPRPASDADLRHYEAWRLWADADRRAAQKQRDSLVGALDNYEQSALLLEGVGQPGSAALALSKAGRLAAYLDEAARSAEAFSRVLSLTPADTPSALRGAALLGLGNAQPARSLEHFEQARTNFREIHDRKGEAIALNGLALALDERHGDSAKAIELLQEVLAIARALGDQPSAAATLHNIAALHRRRGENRQAQRLYAEALALKRAGGDPREQALTLEEMAGLYLESGDYRRAIDLHEEAARLAGQIGNRALEAEALAGVGRARLARGDAEAALEALRRGLELSAETQDENLQASVLSRLGEAYTQVGDLPRARENLQAALRTLRNSGVKYWPIRTLLRLGDVWLREGRVEDAARTFREALDLARSSRAPAFEAAAHDGLARAALAGGDPANAATAGEAALALVESQRARIVESGLQSSYFASVRSYYETAIAASMSGPAEGRTRELVAKAFAISERARARRALDVLVESQLDLSAGAPPGLVAREAALRRNLHAIAAKEAQLLQASTPLERRQALERQLRALTGEHDGVLALLKEASPAYTALLLPITLGLDQVQRELLEPETALVEYFLGEEHSYVWLVTSSSVVARELPRRSTIDAAARALHRALSSRGQDLSGHSGSKARPEEADRQAERGAAELSRMVLPDGLLLPRIRRLVVVADGALHRIPFAVLPYPAAPADPRAGRSRLLSDRFDISYAPSASWAYTQRRRGRRAATAPKTLAILADPVFEHSDPRVRGVPVRRTAAVRGAPVLNGNSAPDDPRALPPAGPPIEVPRLFFSGQEAKMAASFAKGDVLLRLGFEANRENAMSPDLAAYRIVHIAAHALVDDDHPELSGIVVSQFDRHGRRRDGFVGVHDIYSLRLSAELVVLSACHTALGTTLPGEGLLGLARGFMYAGSRQVVASLWSVDDAATADLMRVFYRAILREGRPPAAALREAQTEMARTRKWRAPYYWAGFIVQGDWP
jgi:CHAT domain-containing protein/tetratricopeptide (TPR) repeat protein